MSPPNMPMQYPPDDGLIDCGIQNGHRARFSRGYRAELIAARKRRKRCRQIFGRVSVFAACHLGMAWRQRLEGAYALGNSITTSNRLTGDGDLGSNSTCWISKRFIALRGRRSEFALAAGLRFAGIKLTDVAAAEPVPTDSPDGCR